MDLYIVTAKTFAGRYIERVELLEDMEEKNKSFVGLGRKINKSKLDVVLDGLSFGSYQIIILDKNKINDARLKLKEKIYEYNINKLNEYQADINAINNYNFSQDVKIRDY